MIHSQLPDKIQRAFKERRCGFHSRAKRRLLRNDEFLFVHAELQALGDDAIRNSNAVLYIFIPTELNSKGFKCFIPGLVMQRFGIRQDAVEIEQQSVVLIQFAAAQFGNRRLFNTSSKVFPAAASHSLLGEMNMM